MKETPSRRNNTGLTEKQLKKKQKLNGLTPKEEAQAP
jgi:hypothetical protein